MISQDRDNRMSDWYKPNKNFLYPGKEIMQDTLFHKIPMQQHHKKKMRCYPVTEFEKDVSPIVSSPK